LILKKKLFRLQKTGPFPKALWAAEADNIGEHPP
jgi:hypothetical protein